MSQITPVTCRIMTTLPSIQDLTNDFELKDRIEPRELPSISPLSHSNTFLKPDSPFDVDAFLLSRSAHSSLPELRAELREYLSELKAELVQLLNNDYESFISLSTDLRSEGPRLQRMKPPLLQIKQEIQVSPLPVHYLLDSMFRQKSKDHLQSIQDSVQAKLGERAILREEKVSGISLTFILKLMDHRHCYICY